MRLVLPAVFLLLIPPLLPEPGETHRVSVRRSDVVWIPGGRFSRGSSEADVAYATRLCNLEIRGIPGRVCSPELFLDETPRSQVWVSSYGIDRTEVTQAAHRRCVAASACTPPRVSDADPRFGGDEHPVAGVTWTEAQTYCRWAGGRLPTEAEWERAARGHDRRRFPWGRHYDPRLANHGRATALPPGIEPDEVDGYRHTAPVGSFPDGSSPHGLLDMAGNVFEWTADAYEEDGYALAERIDPTGSPFGGQRVIRGGSYRFSAYMLRVTNRARLAEGEAWPDVGVRCAYDPPVGR